MLAWFKVVLNDLLVMPSLGFLLFNWKMACFSKNQFEKRHPNGSFVGVLYAHKASSNLLNQSFLDGYTIFFKIPLISLLDTLTWPLVLDDRCAIKRFAGLPNDDPNAHIVNFLKICDTYKVIGVTDDAIRLRLFPFSLKDKAKSLLNLLIAGSISTWDDLAKKFLAKFFSLVETVKMRDNITSFMQFHYESLNEAWGTYKDLLRRCPHHGLLNWLQVQTFYNGFLGPIRTTIDAIAKGALMSKSIDEAYNLLKEMASNNYQ
ncbi:Retrotransposon gag domain - like 10 [Theobroma cacao]|nr:Retrotransposon gag domain - like 10 [Theobroma cacao]